MGVSGGGGGRVTSASLMRYTRNNTILCSQSVSRLAGRPSDSTLTEGPVARATAPFSRPARLSLRRGAVWWPLHCAASAAAPATADSASSTVITAPYTGGELGRSAATGIIVSLGVFPSVCISVTFVCPPPCRRVARWPAPGSGRLLRQAAVSSLASQCGSIKRPADWRTRRRCTRISDDVGCRMLRSNRRITFMPWTRCDVF